MNSVQNRMEKQACEVQEGLKLLQGMDAKARLLDQQVSFMKAGLI